MSVTRNTLFGAFAALVAVGYVHGLFRLAEAAIRRGLIGRRDWLVLAGLMFWILLLVGALRLVDRIDPGLPGQLAASAILGMTIGKLVPRPGGSFGVDVDKDM